MQSHREVRDPKEKLSEKFTHSTQLNLMVKHRVVKTEIHAITEVLTSKLWRLCNKLGEEHNQCLDFSPGTGGKVIPLLDCSMAGWNTRDLYGSYGELLTARTIYHQPPAFPSPALRSH